MRMFYVFLFAVVQCSAQLFPFSNLRQYLQQQWKASEYGIAHVPINEQSSSRPYRHTDIPYILSIPAISESFDSIDGFSKNNKDQERLPIKRENSDSIQEKVKLPTRRIQAKRGNQKARKQQPQSTDEVLVTPRPHVKPEQTYTKAKPTKAVQLVQDNADIPPLSVQMTQHVVSTVKTGIDTEHLFVTPSSTQGQPTIVESIPSLTFAVQPTNNFAKNGGLVDYLTPPKLPSVYNVKQPFRLPANYFADSREDDIAAEMSKLKPPPEDPPKKEKQYLIKKYKNDSAKSTSIPDTERYTVASKKPLPTETTRHVRRRPASKQDNNKANKHELSAEKKAELLEAGSQMNEQITAETGFHHSDGAEAAAHHGSGQRVEFQMHGQNGPKTYKFGFDTGKGHNRQFRFEEKDKHGYVKGHYGYYDKSGKLQIVNYEAHPDGGFKADPV